MQLLHAAGKTDAAFDDEHVIAYAGLVPVMRLAERCGLAGLVGEHVRVTDPLGANTPKKIGSIVAGMAAGADSIDDLDVLRHGGMARVFGGGRAPSTVGSFLRCLTWGHVRQLEKAGRVLLGRLAAHTPLLPGVDQVAFVDVDSTQKRIYGPGKQGAGFGHTKVQGKSVLVRGLNALVGTLCTPLAAPVVTGTRLRGGKANSARAAASFVKEQITAARHAGASGTLVVRSDSAFYSAAVARACLDAGRAFRSRSGWTARSRPRSRRSATTRGGQSNTRTRSGTTTPRRGSPTPRPPRPATPRSPPPRAGRSPPG